MSVDTYTNLKSEIASWIDRDDQESIIDTLIDLAEARHAREIRIRSQIKRSRASLSTSTQFLALPTGYEEGISVRLITDPVTPLNYTSPEQMVQYMQSSAGKPKWYTVHEEIEFDRVPDSAYICEFIFYGTFTPLSDSNETNALLTKAPGCYLWGALVAAAPWLDNDERVNLWEGFYQRDRDALIAAHRRSQTPGLAVARAHGNNP